MNRLFRIYIGLVVALVLLNLAPPLPARAATIDVPCNDVPALIAAIHTANTTPEPDILQFPAQDCTYFFDAVDNTSPELGPNALPIITTKIIFKGSALTRLERIGGADGTPFRFFMVAPEGFLVLRNMQLRFGLTGLGESPGSAHSGGAIFNNGGRVHLKNSLLQENAVNPDGTGQGGGIYNAGGTVKWVKCSAFRNRSTLSGGAIYNTGTLVVKQVEFWQNHAAEGGAIHNSGAAQVLRSVFRLNSADVLAQEISNDGGSVSNYGTMEISDSSFFRNHAGYSGGAVANRGHLQLITSTFWRNDGRFGGAIWNTSTVDFANSTLTENTSEKGGGGIHNLGTMTILNVTMAGNDGNNGGNIFTRTGATSIVANTIFFGGLPYNCRGVLEVQGGNLRYPLTDSTCEGEYGDPMLDTLKRNGGPTQTMALLSDSRAINKGLRDNCLRIPVNNHDQRGVERILGDELRCDSGAFEAE